MIDLNNHLFAQLERLSNEELAGKDLSEEIRRAKAVTAVAEQIINNADLGLRAQIATLEYLIHDPLQMLGIKGYEDED